MKAYLFTSWFSQMREARILDYGVSRILCGENEDDARARFESSVRCQNEGDNTTPIKIEKYVLAPVLDELFTEGGHTPIDWAQIAAQVDAATSATDADDFEQGYWADVNQLIDPARLSPDLVSLQQAVPEDVRSGLNWSEAKTFFFLVIVLSPPPPPIDEFAEAEADADRADGDDPADSEGEDLAGMQLRERQVPYLDLAPQELAVLVQARNSVVAAWLWRRFAAKSALASYQIRIEPWCGISGAGREEPK